MGRLRALASWFVAAVLLCLAPQSHATTVLLVDDEEQAAMSTAVVVATIGEQQVELHPEYRQPRTLTTISVEEVLVGDAPASLQIDQFGGTVGGRTLHVPGDAELEPGERCVLFLNQERGQWFLTAMEQSKLSLRKVDSEWVAEREHTGRYLVWGEEGVLEPAHPEPTVTPLAELRDRMSAIEEGGGR